MRKLLIVGALLVASIGLSGLAGATDGAPTADADNAPQCMPVNVDGQTTTACFNLSDDQVQNLGVDEIEARRPRCEMRCVAWGPWGRCLRWRRYCW